jgi:hypothetical protein
MAFNQFKTLAEVLSQFDVVYSNEMFCEILPNAFPSNVFRDQITFSLQTEIYKTSEYARCESLIFPLLQEVWKPYQSTLRLWSHVSISAEEPLVGTPDYLIAQASPLGNIVLGKPILAAVEAKRENFDEGWAQCTAEMLAAQRLNQDFTAIFGIVTNGESWEFGKLIDNHLIRNTLPFSIADLDKLFGALSFVMEECYKQVIKPSVIHS